LQTEKPTPHAKPKQDCTFPTICGLKTFAIVPFLRESEARLVKSWLPAGDFHTVGLKSVGTVLALGDGYFGRCNLDDSDGWICGIIYSDEDGDGVLDHYVLKKRFRPCNDCPGQTPNELSERSTARNLIVAGLFLLRL
jgi:hypothetical protein